MYRGSASLDAAVSCQENGSYQQIQFLLEKCTVWIWTLDVLFLSILPNPGDNLAWINKLMDFLWLYHAYNYDQPAWAYKTPQIHISQVQNGAHTFSDNTTIKSKTEENMFKSFL